MTCLANRVKVWICSDAFLPSRQAVKSLTSCFCLSILDYTGIEKLFLFSRMNFWTTSPTFHPPSYGSLRVIAALKPPKFSRLQQSQLFVPSIQNFAPHALLFSIPHYKVLIAFSNDFNKLLISFFFIISFIHIRIQLIKVYEDYFNIDKVKFFSKLTDMGICICLLSFLPVLLIN